MLAYILASQNECYANRSVDNKVSRQNKDKVNYYFLHSQPYNGLQLTI